MHKSSNRPFKRLIFSSLGAAGQTDIVTQSINSNFDFVSIIHVQFRAILSSSGMIKIIITYSGFDFK
jgi:hypothetical protein